MLPPAKPTQLVPVAAAGSARIATAAASAAGIAPVHLMCESFRGRTGSQTTIAQ
jgi:hypothetical protein